MFSTYSNNETPESLVTKLETLSKSEEPVSISLVDQARNIIGIANYFYSIESLSKEKALAKSISVNILTYMFSLGLNFNDIEFLEYSLIELEDIFEIKRMIGRDLPKERLEEMNKSSKLSWEDY